MNYLISESQMRLIFQWL